MQYGAEARGQDALVAPLTLDYSPTWACSVHQVVVLGTVIIPTYTIPQ